MKHIDWNQRRRIPVGLNPKELQVWPTRRTSPGPQSAAFTNINYPPVMSIVCEVGWPIKSGHYLASHAYPLNNMEHRLVGAKDFDQKMILKSRKVLGRQMYMNDMNVTEYIVAVMSRHFWFTCHIQHHKLLDKTDRIS